MKPGMRISLAGLAAVTLVGAVALAGELHVWVDAEGRTHVTDDPARIPDGAAPVAPGELRTLWEGDALGEPLATPPGGSSSESDRITRALAAAVEDLRRGETARASASLHFVLQREPARAEAHFYLALLEGRRGHLDLAEAHLLAFLGSAGDERFEPWRASARRRLDQLADERRLMSSPAARELRLVALEHPSFRLQADAALVETGGGAFARTVARTLEDVRALVDGALGVSPAEPVGVVLYGRPSYVRTHGSRFSFQTVGFFDGRIHVVSAAHPAGELRSLLAHEYTHALFREQTGGDQPFWWNEGFAERMGRAAQQRVAVTREERARMRAALEAGRWLSLERLAPSFAGLTDPEARLAYTISAFAADWIERRTQPEERARVLRILGEGRGADEALRSVLRLDTAALDAALRRELGG